MDTRSLLLLDWSALAGGGFVATVAFLALVERLRRTFSTRQEFSSLAERVDALQRLCAGLEETSIQATERSRIMERDQKEQWKRLTDQVLRPLQRTTTKLEGVKEAQAGHAATLDQIVQRVDRLDATLRNRAER